MQARRAGRVAVAMAAIAPWTWFAWRDGVRLPALGRVPPDVVLEFVAVLLPVLVTAAVLALVAWAGLRRRPAGLAVAGSTLTFGLVAVVLPWRPDPGPEPVRPTTVVAANVLHRNARTADALADVLAQGGDVVVVPEVTAGVHAGLAARYPHALVAHAAARDARVGVYSRLPLRRDDRRRALLDQGAFRLVLAHADGPLVLYAAHLPSIAPGADGVAVASQRRLLEALGRAVAAEADPVVVAGDLNLVDRSPLFRDLLDRLDDATRSAWRRPTSSKWWALLARVDHVLVSPGWCSARAGTFTVAGSDHRGVRADVGPCPAPAGGRVAGHGPGS